jgi:hypothetical protein
MVPAVKAGRKGEVAGAAAEQVGVETARIPADNLSAILRPDVVTRVTAATGRPRVSVSNTSSATGPLARDQPAGGAIRADTHAPGSPDVRILGRTSGAFPQRRSRPVSS